ncbi:DR1-associated protein 1 (negative cofactor 2 alpha) [Chamberlinius hualienensis]
MPNKKKKYNARFPPARIKKIMQTDEEVGKVAAAVPEDERNYISKERQNINTSSLVSVSAKVFVNYSNDIYVSFRKQCIAVESQFDFLKDVVASVPDVQGDDDSSNPATGETTPLPQSKPSFKPLKRQKRKMSKNNGDEGPGPSRHPVSRIKDSLSNEKSRNLFQDVSYPVHRMHVLPNGATSVIMKPQTSTISVPLTTTTSVQGMDEDYDS